MFGRQITFFSENKVRAAAGSAYPALLAGSSAGIWYSSDGLNWSLTNKTNHNITGLCLGTNRVIAVSYGNGIFYSTDGLNWIASNKTNDQFYEVCKMSSGRLLASSRTGIWYSDDDGTNWTQTASPGIWPAIDFGNGYAVGGSEQFGSFGGLYYSTNGTTWTVSNGADNWYCVRYVGGSEFIAGSDNGIRRSTTNGTGWSGLTAQYFDDMYYDGTYYVGASFANLGLRYSSNFTSWSNSNITTGNFSSVIKRGSTWYAASGSNLGIYYSTNATSWSQTNKTNGTFNRILST